MKDKTKNRCPICQAEFGTRDELEQHEKTRHTQQGLSGVNPSNEYPVSDETASQRKDREFTRRNPE